MRKIAPTSCPVCSASLHVTRLVCESCDTAIEGDFDLGRLGRLSREQLAFVEVFLDCRGKIKDVEERLGLSYPTVVSRLEQVVAALGAPESPKKEARDGNGLDDVLEALARGDVSPKEAAARLRAGRRGRGTK